MLEQANEVQEVLSRSYGMPELDDADLEAGMISPPPPLNHSLSKLWHARVG